MARDRRPVAWPVFQCRRCFRFVARVFAIETPWHTDESFHYVELNNLQIGLYCAFVSMIHSSCTNNELVVVPTGSEIYGIPLGGTLLRQNVAVGGSGSIYITGLVDSAYPRWGPV